MDLIKFNVLYEGSYWHGVQPNSGSDVQCTTRKRSVFKRIKTSSYWCKGWASGLWFKLLHNLFYVFIDIWPHYQLFYFYYFIFFNVFLSESVLVSENMLSWDITRVELDCTDYSNYKSWLESQVASVLEICYCCCGCKANHAEHICLLIIIIDCWWYRMILCFHVFRIICFMYCSFSLEHS